jgi:hypothetical protein
MIENWGIVNSYLSFVINYSLPLLLLFSLLSCLLLIFTQMLLVLNILTSLYLLFLIFTNIINFSYYLIILDYFGLKFVRND